MFHGYVIVIARGYPTIPTPIAKLCEITVPYGVPYGVPWSGRGAWSLLEVPFSSAGTLGRSLHLSTARSPSESLKNPWISLLTG